MCFGFCVGKFFSCEDTLETFRDQSALLGEHLSQKITRDHSNNPIFWPKMSFLVYKNNLKNFVFFCQKANKTSGQNIQNPKNRLPKSCPLSEPQELEVRICMQPNFPIIILILLNRNHKFHRSRGLNSCDSSLHHEIRYLDPFHQNIYVSVCQ